MFEKKFEFLKKMRNQKLKSVAKKMPRGNNKFIPKPMMSNPNFGKFALGAAAIASGIYAGYLYQQKRAQEGRTDTEIMDDAIRKYKTKRGEAKVVHESALAATKSQGFGKETENSKD